MAPKLSPEVQLQLRNEMEIRCLLIRILSDGNAKLEEAVYVRFRDLREYRNVASGKSDGECISLLEARIGQHVYVEGFTPSAPFTLGYCIAAVQAVLWQQLDFEGFSRAKFGLKKKADLAGEVMHVDAEAPDFEKQYHEGVNAALAGTGIHGRVVGPSGSPALRDKDILSLRSWMRETFSTGDGTVGTSGDVSNNALEGPDQQSENLSGGASTG